nr:hypothetical protein [Streptomyces lydicamycinicus]
MRGSAHYTGIVALKATHGRISFTGHWPDSLRRYWHVGPMARCERRAGWSAGQGWLTGIQVRLSGRRLAGIWTRGVQSHRRMVGIVIAMPTAPPRHGPLLHAPSIGSNIRIRSSTPSAVGCCSSSTILPSARKTTRSA